MKPVVKRLLVYLIVLNSSLTFTGCFSSNACVPVVEVVKPERPEIPEAKKEICKVDLQDYENSILEAIKCTLRNYNYLKEERDILRQNLNLITVPK